MRVLFGPGWLIRHAVVVILVSSFIALGWWQVTRAAAGNVLSYGYAVEWPVFAGFVIFLWLKEMRRTLAAARAGNPADGGAEEAPGRRTVTPGQRRAARTGPAYDDSDDAQLAGYNRYLAWLAANPDRSPADYPGV